MEATIYLKQGDANVDTVMETVPKEDLVEETYGVRLSYEPTDEGTMVGSLIPWSNIVRIDYHRDAPLSLPEPRD